MTVVGAGVVGGEWVVRVPLVQTPAHLAGITLSWGSAQEVVRMATAQP